jgi:tRNA pseudouridine38-40 synthase
VVHYQVVLAYDGTGFSGFQRQAAHPKDRTVQDQVESALRRIGWTGRAILAAGRTDSGVHASGQVIAFDLDWGHGPEALQAALNAGLPADISARQVQEAPLDFHPRYDAVARRYRYCLFCDPQRDPLRERYAWRVWPRLDLERMQQAARLLLGQHDFAAFGAPLRVGGSTIRIVQQAEWRVEPARTGFAGNLADDWIFEIVGNAFLYRMVRRTVNLLVEIGRGRREPSFVRQTLESGSKTPLQGLAPPQGLTLAEVIYDGSTGRGPKPRPGSIGEIERGEDLRS